MSCFLGVEIGSSRPQAYSLVGLIPPSSFVRLESSACRFPRLELHTGGPRVMGSLRDLSPMVPLDIVLIGTLCGDFTPTTSFCLDLQAIHNILWNLGEGSHTLTTLAFCKTEELAPHGCCQDMASTFWSSSMYHTWTHLRHDWGKRSTVLECKEQSPKEALGSELMKSTLGPSPETILPS